MADDREAADEMYHEMELSIAGGGGGSGYGNCYSWMESRLPFRTKMPETFSAMQLFFVPLFARMKAWSYRRFPWSCV